MKANLRKARVRVGNVLRRVGILPSLEMSFQLRYRELLAQALRAPQGAGDAGCMGRIRTKAAERRPLPARRSEIRVAAFGTNDDWRRNGIWAAFHRRTRLALFEVPDSQYPGCASDGEERSAKEKDFLKFVDAQNGVDLCVFSHSGRHISDGLLDGLRRRGIWTVIMSADDQHQFFSGLDRSGEPHQLRVARQADLYWTSWRLAAGLVDSLGGNGWFAPHAADPERYRPVPCEKDLEIVFVGGCTAVRKDIVGVLARYFDVRVFGQGWPAGPVTFDESLRLYSRARVVLGIGGIGPSFAVQMLKGRDFEVAMCGATYLTSAYSEVAECFEVGREIACYLSAEDCVEYAARLLRDPERCASMGRAARERCLKSHTWDLRVDHLLDLFGGQGSEEVPKN